MGLVRFSESVYILYLYIHSKYDVIFFYSFTLYSEVLWIPNTT